MTVRADRVDQVALGHTHSARRAASPHFLGRLYEKLSAASSKINAFRDTSPQPQGREIIGSAGSLEIRLARGSEDVRNAQRLRYKIFYKEMSAVPSIANFFIKRDVDDVDRILRSSTGT